MTLPRVAAPCGEQRAASKKKIIYSTPSRRKTIEIKSSESDGRLGHGLRSGPGTQQMTVMYAGRRAPVSLVRGRPPLRRNSEQVAPGVRDWAGALIRATGTCRLATDPLIERRGSSNCLPWQSQ
ncbi:hypothetical protein Acy02nite_90650 [Actinoplanes cyaneus]|uniref:Uncharacterized protein n=1 Tax=Actinoplanes cyaneus TaxID=52696 RepID=A0A919IT06_9ACTN|nr:hypothetical protein Acy02nite_90650 [Actinoplanes cyaneus]